MLFVVDADHPASIYHANPTVHHSAFQCFVTHWDSIFECNCAATFRKVVLRDTQGPRSKLYLTIGDHGISVGVINEDEVIYCND